jgi:hypothetical protein
VRLERRRGRRALGVVRRLVSPGLLRVSRKRHGLACAVPGFLWERALLATGDYLLPRGRNWSFLDDKDGDASWKRLLRADTRIADREARRDVVRRVLVQVDPKDVVGSLQAIVAAGVQGEDAAPIPGFRRHLVLEPRLMEHCRLRMLRIEEDSAFLLARTQRNGYHVDLYVYDLYLRLQTRLAELTPFDINCNYATGIYPPSRLLLRTQFGLSLTIEKHGAQLQLELKLPIPSPQLESRLTNWTVAEENIPRYSVPPTRPRRRCSTSLRSSEPSPLTVKML